MNTVLSSEEQRIQYLQRVQALFEKVCAWSNELGWEASIQEDAVDIREEPIGEYKAPELVISVPNGKHVRMIPKGSWIIGAEGLVDIRSNLGIETLVYHRKDDAETVTSIYNISESGRLLSKPSAIDASCVDLAEGWIYVQNRTLGILPQFDKDLFQLIVKALTE